MSRAAVCAGNCFAMAEVEAAANYGDGLLTMLAWTTPMLTGSARHRAEAGIAGQFLVRVYLAFRHTPWKEKRVYFY
jgi:hypothetical protein